MSAMRILCKIAFTGKRLAPALLIGFLLGCTAPAVPAAPTAPAAPATQAPQSDATNDSGAKKGGVLTVLMNQSGDPPSFDLHQESGSAAIETAGPVYENLLSFDPLDPKALVPELADTWEFSQDGRSLTFRLHPGVSFQNGNSFTAADAKFSLERIASPPKGLVSPRKSTLAAIEAIEAPEERTLLLRLKQPNPSLLFNLAQAWMVMYDKEWLEANGPLAAEREVMGTGPFRLKEHVTGSHVTVERNPDYWQPGKPYLDAVKTLNVPDFGTRVAAFRTGQVHIERFYPRDGKELQKELGEKILMTVQPAPSFGALYMNAAKPPFDNPKLRAAVNLAIDRDAAVEVLSQGEGLVGGYLMPGGAWSLSEEEVRKFPGYAKDKATELEQAKALLKEAGVGSGFSVDIISRNGRSFIALSVFVQDQLTKLGITSKVVPTETAPATELARKGDFQLLTWGHEFALDDPDTVYGEFYICGGARNWAGLCSTEADALYEKQSQEVDTAKRKALVQEMERKAVPEAIKIVTHWNRRFDGQWAFVKDYLQHPSPFTNVRYRDVWLDK